MHDAEIAVNAWRAVDGLGPLPTSQIDSNHVSSDNLQAAWTTNELSNSFGRILQAFNRQQAELAVRLAF